MPRLALTDRFIAGAKSKTAQTDFFDARTLGLVLRVSASGVKSWNLFFTAPSTGKRARTTLGRYPRTTLAEARTRALEAMTLVDAGADPRDVSGGAMTVQQLVGSYLEKHVRPNLRSRKAVERRLTKNVLPLIGSIAVAELHKRDITRVLDRIAARGCAVEGARVFQDLRAMCRWAVSRGDLDHNPLDGMEPPAAPKPRERVLTDDEVATLWAVLPEALQRSPAVQNIIKLCLLTGQRVGEVAGIHADELDLKARVWTIPAARSKNGYAHAVPLTDAAIAVINAADGVARGFVFPDTKGNGPLASNSVAKTIRLAQDRMGLPQWTAHDLRRTAVTGMAKLGVSPIVLGHVINHRSVTKAGVTLAVYSQYNYAKEKREALDLWAARLAGIVGGAKLLPMRR